MPLEGWRGADLLLQVRCAVYDGTLGCGFGGSSVMSMALLKTLSCGPAAEDPVATPHV